jgi:uncharacterized protein (DUF2141 family)
VNHPVSVAKQEVRMTTTLRVAAFLIAISAPTLAEAAGIDVTLHVTGIEQQKGEVFAGLYDAAGWSGDHFVSATHVAVNGSDATLHLTAPGPGKYAVKLFHDLDGTGTLTRNFLGIPKEPYAFSNNATARMGPPDFAAAAFDVNAGGAKEEVHLQ